MNSGKSIYFEYNDFGYAMSGTAFYQMFGCTYAGDGNVTNNVQVLTGQPSTLLGGSSMSYLYGVDPVDEYVDFITANGGDLLFKSQDGRGRAVAYSGANGTYRTIHATFVFGAMTNRNSSHSKLEVMDAYMRYLMGDSLVCGIDREVSVAAQDQVNLFVEAGPAHAGREYLILGTTAGTDPGIPVGSVTLPLNPGSFFDFVLMNINTSIFQNFYGVLDVKGRACGVLDTQGPLNPNKIGKTMHYAYLVGQPLNFASNSAPVLFVP